MSAYVGICTRSVGKPVFVSTVPCGASGELLSAPDCAHAAVANNNTNNPVFFMLPPGASRHASASVCEMPERERLQPEGNKGVREGQGYEGDGHTRVKVFLRK